MRTFKVIHTTQGREDQRTEVFIMFIIWGILTFSITTGILYSYNYLFPKSLDKLPSNFYWYTFLVVGILLFFWKKIFNIIKKFIVGKVSKSNKINYLFLVSIILIILLVFSFNKNPFIKEDSSKLKNLQKINVPVNQDQKKSVNEESPTIQINEEVQDKEVNIRVINGTLIIIDNLLSEDITAFIQYHIFSTYFGADYYVNKSVIVDAETQLTFIAYDNRGCSTFNCSVEIVLKNYTFDVEPVTLEPGTSILITNRLNQKIDLSIEYRVQSRFFGVDFTNSASIKVDPLSQKSFLAYDNGGCSISQDCYVEIIDYYYNGV